MDLYDMKPEAPSEFAGIWRPIRTSIVGFEISDFGGLPNSYPRSPKGPHSGTPVAGLTNLLFEVNASTSRYSLRPVYSESSKLPEFNTAENQIHTVSLWGSPLGAAVDSQPRRREELRARRRAKAGPKNRRGGPSPTRGAPSLALTGDKAADQMRRFSSCMFNPKPRISFVKTSKLAGVPASSVFSPFTIDS